MALVLKLPEKTSKTNAKLLPGAAQMKKFAKRSLKIAVALKSSSLHEQGLRSLLL